MNHHMPPKAQKQSAQADEGADAPSENVEGAEAQAQAQHEGAEAQKSVQYDVELPFGGAPPLCRKCKNEIDFEARTGRVMGKCANSWICRTCNTRSVQISRLDKDKTFSIKFKQMDEDLKIEFWNQCQSKVGADDLKQVMGHFLEHSIERANSSHSKGEYQPLSWYERQGYDPEAIVAQCKDVMTHKILGPCYRVTIQGGGFTTTSFERRGQILNATPKDAKPTSGGFTPSRHTANVQEDQAAVAQLKSEQANLMLNQKKQKMEASKTLSKLSAELVQMELLQKQKGVKDLPDTVKAKMLGTTHAIKEAVANCKLVLVGKAAAIIDPQEATDLAKRAKLQQQFVTKLLTNNLFIQMP
jgi:hypothetical protein